MTSQLLIRRVGLTGPGADSLETVNLTPPGYVWIGNNGATIALPLMSIIDFFDRLPVVTTVVATSDRYNLLLGSNTPVAAQDAKGGLTLTTGATGTNQAAVAGIVNTGFSAALSVTNHVAYRARVNLASLATMFASAGINSLATDVNPMATAGDGAAFLADPTNSLTATTGATAAQALNWILCYKVGGAYTYAFTSVPLAAALDVYLKIQVNPDLTASMYIEDVLVGTSPALTAGAVVKPLAGVETTASATAAMSVRFEIFSRDIG